MHPKSRKKRQYVFSKEQGTNTIKVPVKLRPVAYLHLAAFAAVERTAITHTRRYGQEGDGLAHFMLLPVWRLRSGASPYTH